MDRELWLLGCIGITTIISVGAIFAPIRRWIGARVHKLGELVSCPMCCGFWVGFLWELLVAQASLTRAFIAGGSVSVLSYAANVFIDSVAYGRREE